MQLKQQYVVMKDLLAAQGAATASATAGPATAIAAVRPPAGKLVGASRSQSLGAAARGGGKAAAAPAAADERLASLVSRLTEPGMLDKMELLASHLERMSVSAAAGGGGDAAVDSGAGAGA